MSRPAGPEPRLPAAVSEAARFYLRPVGLTCGKAAEKFAAAGKAKRLAGGPWFFAACEVVLRRPNGFRRTTAALGDIEAWADRLQAQQRDRIGSQLARLTAPRVAPDGAPLTRPLIMGMIDVTSDGRPGGGERFDPEAAVSHGCWLAAAGADLLEVVGDSARHGAQLIAPEAETKRILPVTRGLADLAGIPISIDTRYAEVSAAALRAGATMIGDGAPLIGDPQSPSAISVVRAQQPGGAGTTEPAPGHDELVLEIFDDLEARIEAQLAAGIPHARLIVDPGIDTSGNDGNSIAILNDLALFHSLGCPLLLGLSFDGDDGDQGRAAALRALDRGTQILRTRDVSEIRQILDIWERLIASGR
jgi:dihydropteroate synthase